MLLLRWKKNIFYIFFKKKKKNYKRISWYEGGFYYIIKNKIVFLVFCENNWSKNFFIDWYL